MKRRSSLLEGELDPSQPNCPGSEFPGKHTEEDDSYGNEDHEDMVITQERQDS